MNPLVARAFQAKRLPARVKKTLFCDGPWLDVAFIGGLWSERHDAADICDFNFGADSWTNPANNLTFNQMWNGWYFEVQTMWSNHLSACAQAGP
jgi:hypothetical protein